MTSSDPRPLFIFCLPRSGSTYLQTMVASHSAVSSANESWFLIPLLYSLRREGVYAEYGHRIIVDGIEDLCRFLPGGQADYRDEIRQLALRLYRRLSDPAARYYLDKTPRYHMVVDDIIELFGGDASFVFLWRNPLAVASSMLDMGNGPRWFPEHHKVDLYTGLARLTAAYARHRDHVLSVRYEDLVAEPCIELGRIVDYADLEWEETMLRAPDERCLIKWHAQLDTPVRRGWARRYLRWIGAERLRVMGYDIDELIAELHQLPLRGQLMSDAWHTFRSGAASASEPTLWREKLARWRAWETVHLHK